MASENLTVFGAIEAWRDLAAYLHAAAQAVDEGDE